MLDRHGGNKSFYNLLLSVGKEDNNTPGTRVGPGFRDQTLAVKSKRDVQKSAVFW